MNYTDLEMNLFILQGDEDQPDTYFLSAYGRDEHDQLDTANYISVEISQSDYKAFTDDEDAWYGSGAYEYEALVSIFILYQLSKKAESK